MEKTPRFQGFCCTSALNTFICNQLQITGTFLKNLEKWATAERLGIPEFKYADRACFYPKIYERCFREYPEEGYAFLESVMSGKDPSPGYSIRSEERRVGKECRSRW